MSQNLKTIAEVAAENYYRILNTPTVRQKAQDVLLKYMGKLLWYANGGTHANMQALRDELIAVLPKPEMPSDALTIYRDQVNPTEVVANRLWISIDNRKHISSTAISLVIITCDVCVRAQVSHAKLSKTEKGERITVKEFVHAAESHQVELYWYCLDIESNKIVGVSDDFVAKGRKVDTITVGEYSNIVHEYETKRDRLISIRNSFNNPSQYKFPTNI